MNKLSSKNINLRLVEIDDAEFIVNLRLKKGKFLSKIDANISKQIEWIDQYKKREEDQKEYYFIIEDKKKIRLGTIRIYDISHQKKSFTFGSFIVDRDNCDNKFVALESITTIFGFAFNNLSLKDCFFNSRKNNKKANNFYKKFKAKIIKEDKIDYFYQYTRKNFLENISNYKSIYDPIS